MDLTISQIIKIVLGVVVIVVVISALAYFGSNIGDFFQNLPGATESSKFYLGLIK
ncbi:MAG: hypothetical protein WDZ77_01005 [Candidatus Pacearchaeota archaeon]